MYRSGDRRSLEIRMKIGSNFNQSPLFRSMDGARTEQVSTRTSGEGSRVSFRGDTVYELTPASSIETGNGDSRLENLIRKVSNSDFIDHEMSEKVHRKK